ncbi:MAG: amino acid racemase, partial [Clostridiales Family XIII bacterium]|nr:amino acid racemase [Clostridiales Family XIII bacterium]
MRNGNGNGNGKRLGVLGGMGPAASLLFYGMVIEHTVACRDQEHIDMIILSHATMPDRTEMLGLGRGAELLARIVEDALALERCGADALAITCNTSHVLADAIQAAINVPLINMVKEAVAECAAIHERRPAKIAVLGTDGTIKAGMYQREMEAAGLLPHVPSPEGQKLVMRMIYDGVKRGGAVDYGDLAAVEKELREAGCDGAIMACTEMSVLKDRF